MENVNEIKFEDTKFFMIDNDFNGYLEFRKNEKRITFKEGNNIESYSVSGCYHRLQDAMEDLLNFLNDNNIEDWYSEEEMKKSKFNIYLTEIKKGKRTEKKVFTLKAKDVKSYMNY